MGLWFRALLVGESEEYRRLGPRLNGGLKGWNDDEPAVVEAVCQLAARQYFDEYSHVSVDEFAADLCRRIASGKTPPRQEDMEAVIRAALDETAVPSDIRRAELLNIRSAVAGCITDILKLEAQDIDRLVGQAEGIAMARGYHPPLVSEP